MTSVSTMKEYNVKIFLYSDNNYGKSTRSEGFIGCTLLWLFLNENSFPLKTDIIILLEVKYSYLYFLIVITSNFQLLAMMIDGPSLIFRSMQV